MRIGKVVERTLLYVRHFKDVFFAILGSHKLHDTLVRNLAKGLERRLERGLARNLARRLARMILHLSVSVLRDEFSIKINLRTHKRE